MHMFDNIQFTLIVTLLHSGTVDLIEINFVLWDADEEHVANENYAQIGALLSYLC